MYATLGHHIGQILLACSVGLTGLAFARGGFAERLAATALLLAWVVSGVLEAALPDHSALAWLFSVPVLSIEFALSMTFLGLALRYGSLWLGGAMLAQGVQLGIHAFYISGGGYGWRRFALASNVISGTLLLLLLAATMTNWRRRLHLQREPSPFGVS